MKILYQDLAQGSGAQASYKMLLQAMLKEHPNDQFMIICSKNAFYQPLAAMPNVQIVSFHSGILREFQRFWLEIFGIRRIAQRFQADVIWTDNIGPYVRTGIPQVLVVLNFFQACPWSLIRNHPRSRQRVAFLRWFFRRSLRCCDAVQVETALLAELVRRIPGAPPWIEVIPKAVESAEDFESQSLPPKMLEWFDGGLGRSTFTFLYVAAYSSHKNHAAVVAAMNLLRSQGVSARLA